MTKDATNRDAWAYLAPYTLATVAPAGFLLAGAPGPTVWLWAVLAWIALASLVLDTLLPDQGQVSVRAAALAGHLNRALALMHFGLFWLGIGAVSGATGLDGSACVLAFFAFGLYFGQVSNANGHELIHRPDQMSRMLGTWVFVTHLFGHHASAHPQVHHRFVATPDDPNSARKGEGFYRFAARAWAGSFRAGLRAETARQNQKPGRWHPYRTYTLGALAGLAISGVVFGWAGVLAHLGLAGYATAQLLLSDYVQHYGLRRLKDADGRYEPVGPAHSWDAPRWFSTRLMLNAPRHADHHLHPGRGFTELRTAGPKDTPTLPHGLPVMATLALFPHLWRRVMDPRLARWRG